MKLSAFLILITFSYSCTPDTSEKDVTASELDKVISDCEKLKQDMMRLKCSLQEIQGDKEKLTFRIGILRQYVTDVDTYYRNDNLEILGVPQAKGENLLEILRNISTAIDVPFSEDHISIVWRNREQIRTKFTPEVDSIIVLFVSRTMRRQWLKRGRDMIVIYSKGCLPELPESEIYINEHLTKDTKGLVKSAKLLEGNGAVSFVWLKDGHVYIRQTPMGKAIKIKSLRDLQIFGYKA